VPYKTHDRVYTTGDDLPDIEPSEMLRLKNLASQEFFERQSLHHSGLLEEAESLWTRNRYFLKPLYRAWKRRS